MQFTDTKQLFRQAGEYPMDVSTVEEQFGDVEVEAPTGETTRVGTVLARSSAHTYNSAEDLYTELVGNLDESFIGRKYYDDRGGELPNPDPEEFSQ